MPPSTNIILPLTPSKRGFAEHLQVSVKTVKNAYEQLLLEGYIRSEEKRGYYVNKIDVVTSGAPGYASPVRLYKEEEYRVDLTANNTLYNRFPFSTWARIMRETLTDYNTSLLKTVPFGGVMELREAIADYLNRYRGMQVSADHIIIGAGTHFLLHVKTMLSDVEIKWAAKQRGILVNCLSEYCFADAKRYQGVLVIHYSDMDDETLDYVVREFEEIFLG